MPAFRKKRARAPSPSPSPTEACNSKASTSRASTQSTPADEALPVAKKLRIAPRIGKPFNAEEAWKTLEKGIEAIYDRTGTHLSFEQLYRCAYKMIQFNFGHKLKIEIEKSLAMQLQRFFRAMEEASMQGNNTLFLKELNDRWMNHVDSVRVIRSIVIYGERNNPKILTNELSVSIWRDYVIRSAGFRMAVRASVLDLVNRERKREVMSTDSRQMLSSPVRMMLDAGTDVYEEEVERPLLESSVRFYGTEAMEMLQLDECTEYLKGVEKRCTEEMERAERCTWPRGLGLKLVVVVEREMIEKHLKEIIGLANSGLVRMLEDERMDALSRVYSVLSRYAGGSDSIRDSMTAHVEECGKKIVMDLQQIPKVFVDKLVELWEKYEKIVRCAFCSNKSYEKALGLAFRNIVNRNDRAAEYISLFLDEKLRTMKSKEDEFEAIVSSVVCVLIRQLQDKDVFEKYYKMHLSKRLLSGRSMDCEDAEWSVILKLRMEYGFVFTRKLEAMFLDLKTSQELMHSFDHSSSSSSSMLPSISIQVLTSGSWPTSIAGCGVICNLPSELVQQAEKFKMFYLSKFSGRRITFLSNLGTAELKATFDGGRKHEVIVTTYQMCVLMLFNREERMTMKEIHEATGIPISELKRCLQSLALVKGKNILVKTPMSKEIEEEDVFRYNSGFVSRLYRVKLGLIRAKKESEEEKKETVWRVEEDRKPQIQAAIVRVMKSRKSLDHNNLVSQVISQVQSRFVPDPLLVKKHIEGLIDRGFISRDDDDRKLYHYQA